MSTYIILAILLVFCVVVAYRYIRQLRRGDSCCSTGSEPAKRVRVKDRNKNSYPYTAVLTIDGMTCANCALKVENALNTLPGIWCSVDLGAKKATVRGKTPWDKEQIQQAVRQSGYLVLAFETAQG